MDLDSKGLGRLHRAADPRQIWAMEAGDFTPWLVENLDVLADELGLVLTLVATEVPVGSFWLAAQRRPPGLLRRSAGRRRSDKARDPDAEDSEDLVALLRRRPIRLLGDQLSR